MANGTLQMKRQSKVQNPVQEKSYSFAVSIVKYSREMMHKHEYVLSKQLLRSGTSIGANIEEAQQAQSKKDFYAKMCIALKEAYESRYWLRLIADSIQTSPLNDALKKDCEDIIRLLVAITKSTNIAIQSTNN